MKVNASDDTRSPESLELALRAFAFSAGGLAYANAAPVAQIFTGELERPALAWRSSPIRCGIKRSPTALANALS